MNNLLHFAILFYSIFYFCFAKYLTRALLKFHQQGIESWLLCREVGGWGGSPLSSFFSPG